jgi:succinate-semialdehyde dehydrogenase/glutarate-semialdehyde dehydrogenase
MAIATINPATGETLKTFSPLSDAEIETKLANAHTAFETYRKTSFSQRSQWLEGAAGILEAEKLEFARIMTTEMGKPIRSAIAEVEKCASVCRFYAEKAPEFLADVSVVTDASRSYITYQPLGIILAVMPWNFPFWQVFRFVAPALMAGNVGVLKHASNVPQSALAIESIIRQAGFLQDVFQTLLIGADLVEEIVRDPRIKAATLTGSEPAGRALAAVAGSEIKKVVLELGGSDPFIVLESADIDKAVATAVQARMINNGQSCIAAKRFIIAQEIADRFETEFVARFESLRIGDPTLENTDIGPLATRSILTELDEQVQRAIADGAKLLTGGKPVANSVGNFYLPTILTGLDPDSDIAKEEFFGPVAMLFRVQNIDEAISIANNTSFGLGASAWTNKAEESSRLIAELKAGSVFINSMVKSDPRLPFGGIEHSGYGRELSVEGIREFVNIKTVWIA